MTFAARFLRFALLTSFLFSLPWILQAAGAGTRPAAFLRLGVGARAAALGQASVALSDDAGAVYWNPGALSRLNGGHALFSHGSFLNNDLSYDAAAAGRALPGVGVLGLLLQHASVGALPRLDGAAQETGSFSPADTAGTVALARTVQGHGLGISLKFVRSKILNAASTVAGGVGYLSPPLWEGTLRVGVAADNWGGKLKYADRGETLPALFRVGVAYVPRPGWEAVFDVERVQKTDPIYGGGLEYHRDFRGGRALLRGGYTTRTKDRGTAAGFSAGAGVLFRKIGLDYAFLPDGDLGYTHLLNLSFLFP
ncbi:MAG TPA: PorV/PorQ family protein [Elusimicrobiota bacterium]|nr:PorV/PorQ family protein [Elusimicrobiota bacterium]